MDEDTCVYLLLIMWMVSTFLVVLGYNHLVTAVESVVTTGLLIFLFTKLGMKPPQMPAIAT